MALIVLLGGARSGKSTLSVRLAQATGLPVTVLTTAEGRDREMVERITRHRSERPSRWTTIEEPVELVAALGRVAPGSCLVLDCLTLWVANLLERDWTDEAVEEEARRAALDAAARPSLTVAVSNEVGLGIVPESQLGRRYRDLLGRVNAIWVGKASEAALVVAGRALPLAPAEAVLLQLDG